MIVGARCLPPLFYACPSIRASLVKHSCGWRVYSSVRIVSFLKQYGHWPFSRSTVVPRWAHLTQASFIGYLLASVTDNFNDFVRKNVIKNTVTFPTIITRAFCPSYIAGNHSFTHLAYCLILHLYPPFPIGNIYTLCL